MGIKVPAGFKLPANCAQLCRDFLQEQTDSFGTYMNQDRIYYHIARSLAKQHEFEPLLRMYMMSASDVKLDRPAVINALRHVYGIPDVKLLNAKGIVSIDKTVMKSLLEDPAIHPQAKELVKAWGAYANAGHTVSTMRGLLSPDISHECAGRDMNNCKMRQYHPTWKILSTSRFSASDPNVQNVDRGCQDIFTAPKGWMLVHSDSGQIEPRITYSAFIPDLLIKHLITLYDDAYYGLLHFILLKPEEEEWSRTHLSEIQKLEITDDIKNKRKILKVLGLAGNYGSANLAAVDAELGPLYEQKIVSHPMRREWERRVADEVRNGADHFYAYFGTPVYPEQSSSDKYTDGAGWKNHLIRCGINNPVQTTASELMHISIQEVRRIIKPNEHVAAYIHDAGLFYIPEDSVEERAPVYQNCLAYDVEGWIPIGSDLHVGVEDSPYAQPLF